MRTFYSAHCFSACLLMSVPFTVSATPQDDAHVIVEAASDATASPTSTTGIASDLPPDVEFVVEPLYPARNNQSRAKIDMVYSCVPENGGGRVVPCYITLDPPMPREGTGGHLSPHTDPRPAGKHVPSEGWVSESDGYFRTTYHASEVGGVVDVTAHCNALIVPCRDGVSARGVAITGLADLGTGPGYVLTGAKDQHPSNHWGNPAFIAALKQVALKFSETYPDAPLRYNDISLEYGGIFDVATRTKTGYDWTPPHATHRLGTNIDIGIPGGDARRKLLETLFRQAGVGVYKEDSDHWHLTHY